MQFYTSEVLMIILKQITKCFGEAVRWFAIFHQQEIVNMSHRDLSAQMSQVFYPIWEKYKEA